MKKLVLGAFVLALLISCQFGFLNDLSNPNDPLGGSYLLEVSDAAADPRDEGVQLSWKHPSESKAEGALVTWSPAEGPTQPVKVAAGQDKLFVEGLKNGTTYRFQIRAYNTRGDLRTGVEVLGTPTGQRFRVTYDGNQATSGTAPVDEKFYKAGSPLILAEQGDLIRTGYNWNGWNTKPDGTGDQRAAGGSYTLGAGDLVWYAQWKGQTRRLQFSPNGGTGTMADMEGATGKIVKLPTPGFTRAGWTFAGWAETSEGTGTAWADGGEYTFGSQDTVLYAKWMSSTNTVSFNANGGTGIMADQTILAGNTQALTKSLFTRSGYSFTGWNTEVGSTGTSYGDQAGFTMGPSSQVLYARWSPLVYGISYSLEGGINHGGNPSSYTVETESLILKAPLKEGYSFKGWYSEPEHINPVTQISKGTTGEKSFWAKWASSNADLSGLTVHGGYALSPSFEPSITAYTVNVPEGTTSITVTGVPALTSSTMSSNSGAIQSLGAGTNVVTISVSAEDGLSTKSYVVTVLFLAPPSNPPLAPLNMSASPGNGQVTVNWSASADAIGYKVYYKQGSGTTVLDTLVPESMMNGTRAVVTGLTNEIQYSFIVVAFNSAGNSPASVAALATPTAGIPGQMAGATWTERTITGQLSSKKLLKTAISDSGMIRYSAAYGEYIYKSINNGVTWERLDGAGSANWANIICTPDGGYIYAIASGIPVKASLDGGSSWNNMNSGTVSSSGTGDLAVAADGKKMIGTFSSSTAKYINISIDSGQTWNQNTALGSSFSRPRVSRDGSVFYVVNYGGYIYRSTDNGSTWTQLVGAGMGNWSVLLISDDGTKICAVRNNYGSAFVSQDFGETWTERTSLGTASGNGWQYGTGSSNLNRIVIAGGQSILKISNNFGETWVEQTNIGTVSTDRVYSHVTGTGDFSTIVATLSSSDKETVSGFSSADLGQTWIPFTVSADREWKIVSTSSDLTKIAAVVSGLSLQVSTDGGVTWTEIANRSGWYWRSVEVAKDGGIIYAVDSDFFGNNARVFKSTDDGKTWAAVKENLGIVKSVKCSQDGATVALVIGSGILQYSKDYGSTWTSLTSVGSKSWSSVAVSENGQKIFATESNSSGYLYQTFNAGTDWAPNATCGTRYWSKYGLLSGSSDLSKLIALMNPAGSTRIYTSADSGNTWVQQSIARNWTSVAISADGTRMAAAASPGYIYTSTDGGVTWNELTAAGLKSWSSITLSADASKMIAVTSAGEKNVFISP